MITINIYFKFFNKLPCNLVRVELALFRSHPHMLDIVVNTEVFTFILASYRGYSLRTYWKDWYQLWWQDFWILPQVTSVQILSQRKKSQRMEQQMTKNPWGKARLPNEAPSPKTKTKPRTMNIRGEGFRDGHNTVCVSQHWKRVMPLGGQSCHWGHSDTIGLSFNVCN